MMGNLFDSLAILCQVQQLRCQGWLVCGHALPLRLQSRQPDTCGPLALVRWVVWAQGSLLLCEVSAFDLQKNMKIWRIILIKHWYHRFNQCHCFWHSAVLFGIFNLTPGYHGFVTAVCEEAGVIDDLLGQWPLNRFASQIVRVETTVSLGIVRQCCVVHRPSCRRCRADWGLITFITSYPHRHQARPQLVWKMSPSRTSALAHWCTTLVSSQGMLWWPRTDVWMNAKGTCFSLAKQGTPKHKTPFHIIPQEVWCLDGALF